MSLSEAQSPTKRRPGSDAARPQLAPSRTVPSEITVKQPPSAPIWIVPEAGKVLMIEKIGVSGCFPLSIRLAGGPPTPRQDSRFPPAFQWLRSGFHGFQCRSPLRFSSAKARQDAAPPNYAASASTRQNAAFPGRGQRGLEGRVRDGGRTCGIGVGGADRDKRIRLISSPILLG